MMDLSKAPDPIMVMGTNKHLDYMAFARAGSLALSVKFQDIANGGKMGSPDTVWVGARLRASIAQDELPSGPPSNVLQFQSVNDSIGKVFTEVVWEKDDHRRASTTVGGLFQGSLASPAAAIPFVKTLVNGEIALQMAEYLQGLAIGGEMLFTVAELALQLQKAYFGPLGEQLEKKLVVYTKARDSMAENVGSFGMQAQLLKKAYESVEAPEKVIKRKPSAKTHSDEQLEDDADLGDADGDNGHSDD